MQQLQGGYSSASMYVALKELLFCLVAEGAIALVSSPKGFGQYAKDSE